MASNVVHAIVPSAGKGRRMQSAFPGIPKVLVPLGDRAMLRWVIESVSAVDAISGISVVVSPEGLGPVQKALDNLTVRFAIQSRPLGTGDAVRVGLAGIPQGTDTVLIVNGDQPLFRPQTLSKLIVCHREQKATLSFLTVQVDQTPPKFRPLFADWGRVVRDEQKKPVKVVEMRDASETEKAIREVNPSVYCIDVRWLGNELPKIKPTNAQSEYYLTDVIEVASNQNVPITTVSILDPREALGANDPEQLRLLAKVARELAIL